MNIPEQVISALDAATHENQYPHEYWRSPSDIVLEIHDWSGIENFDPNNVADMDAAIEAVAEWRTQNPK